MAIRGTLMGHQKLMVNFTLETHKKRKRPYVGLFADYGVGKSLTALKIVDELRLKKVLVVSTMTSIESTWPNEIRQWSNFRFYLLTGTREQKLRILNRGIRATWDSFYYHNFSRVDTTIFLINYRGLRNIAKELAEANFDAMICDESTHIKNPSTQQTKYAWAIGQYCKYRYILTGFPITEGLHEIYAQIKFLDHGEALGKSYYGFLSRHFIRTGNVISPKRSSVDEIIKAISPFCIRVTNKHLKLPPKVYKTIEVTKTEAQTEVLRKLHNLFRIELGKVKIDVQYIFTLIAKSLQICDGFVMDGENVEVLDTNKDKALLEVLDDIDIHKNKVVIWSNYRFTIRKLELILKKAGVTPLTLYGETEDVKHVVDTFQLSPKHRVLIASQKKASESITLTSAAYAVYYSHVYSYDNRSNSEARIRRKGSEKHRSVVYTDLLTKGTIERDVYRCLVRKQNLVKALQEQFLKMKGDDYEN